MNASSQAKWRSAALLIPMADRLRKIWRGAESSHKITATDFASHYCVSPVTSANNRPNLKTETWLVEIPIIWCIRTLSTASNTSSVWLKASTLLVSLNRLLLGCIISPWRQFGDFYGDWMLSMWAKQCCHLTDTGWSCRNYMFVSKY